MARLDIKAVIYDFDGVIVDSLEANVAYYNRLLRYFSLPPVRGEHLELIQTRTSHEVIEVLFPNPAQAQEAQAVEKQLNNDEIIPLIRLEPYVRETLAELKNHYHTAIATNRGKSLPLVLEFHNLGRYFDLTVSSAKVQHPKPHPDYLDIILREFSLASSQALYVGDAEVDAQLAAAAGVAFLAYKNRKLSAWAHLQDHRDIWAILESERANRDFRQKK
jgi:HAD superfamily hydrolase (TIGR01509 family)